MIVMMTILVVLSVEVAQEAIFVALTMVVVMDIMWPISQSHFHVMFAMKSMSMCND